MQKNEDLQEENKNLCDPGPSAGTLFPWLHNGMDSSAPAGGPNILRMMQKMGYKLGSGLGKDEQGITESIKLDTNLGKRGLGLKLGNLNLSDELWDFSQENIIVREKVQWLENQSLITFNEDDFKNWIKEGSPNKDVAGNSSFCDDEVLKGVFKAKDIFDELNILELNQARARANPFETIRSVFFMNRAALKMANIDAACDFMFTKMEENAAFSSGESPIYFADVCAGPGGFTEYILWRKWWLYKGFGLTLRDEHDFRVSESTCASAVSFQALYGQDGTGDVCNPFNLRDFTARVGNETEGKGVHFMMSDGGFCVDGQENLQEVLSKNIYLCQCLLALYIVRPNGSFVTKTFDIFTPFSVGLLYLMYLCFEQVGILKPNSSRPANSERYFVCKHYKPTHQSEIIKNYLWKIAARLWEIRDLPNIDVLQIVPVEVIMQDKYFFQYIFDSNSSIGRKQIIALKKLAQFCRNPKLIESQQATLREQCLEYWNIPDKKRKPYEIYKVDNIMENINFDAGILLMQPVYIHCTKHLENSLDLQNWHYLYLNSTYQINRAHFYAGIEFSKVFRLINHKWRKVKDLELVKGTLLFGEFVKETSALENNQVKTTYSLHVIDAVFLGSMDLQAYSFQERQRFIHIFCKAVNKESQSEYSVRVRPKPIRELQYLPKDLELNMKEYEDNFWVTLPQLGYKSLYEKYEVNSILLMKTNACQSFQSTHVLRLQVFNIKEEDIIPRITFKDLGNTVTNLFMS